MIQVQTALIFLIGKHVEPELTSSLEQTYILHQYADIKDAIKTLQNIRCDLLIIDDASIEPDVISMIQRAKYRFPSLLTILLTSSTDRDYQRQVHNAGANEVMLKPLTSEALCNRVDVLLGQSQQRYALVQLNRNLHVLASLPRLLYDTLDPHALIVKATRLIRNMLNLYGVVVALSENTSLRLYESSEEVADRSKLRMTVVQPQKHDPWLWATHNRVTQVYQDITVNPHFAPIAALSAAKTVVIVPLIDPENTIGAMGIFVPPDYELTDADLLIYEQVAVQLVLALHNARQHQEQVISIQSGEQRLRAWQVFAKLQTAAEIVRTLREMIESTPYIGKVLVELDADEDRAFDKIVETSGDGSLASVFDTLRETRWLRGILSAGNDEFQSVVLQARTLHDPVVKTITEAMQVRAIIIVPLIDAAELRGVIIAGITDEHKFQAEHIHLIERLAHIAALSLNGIALSSALAERNSRLEGILHGISEGVFFVNDNNKVAFSNPQVSELTGISASTFIDQDAEVLLRAMAAGTENASKTYAQLQASRSADSDANDANEDYPIVQLTLPNVDRELSVEFIKVHGLEANKASWAGVIHNEPHVSRTSKLQEQIFSSMSESLRIPYTQVRSLVGTLTDDHGHFSYHERQMLLDQAKTGIDRVGQLWNNFLQAYRLEIGEISLERENVDIEELLHRVLNVSYAGKSHPKFEVTIAPDLPLVKIDEFHIRGALANIVQHALDVSVEGSIIRINAETRDTEIGITISDTARMIDGTHLESIFEPVSQASATGSSDFGLYVARELIRRHGGHVWAEKNGVVGTAINITIPFEAPAKAAPKKVNSTAAETPEPIAKTVQEQPLQLPARASNRAPNRSPQLIMAVTGESTLAKSLYTSLESEYNVMVYQTGKEALQDIRATRWDLIVIDVQPSDVNGIELCMRIRKETETPIILVADNTPDDDKVRGLTAGADDYITRPISEGEMMARIQVIFKRQHLAARMSEPLAIGDLYIDIARREVFLANKPIELTRIEYDLLYFLVTNKGQVLTHKQLLEKVWGPDYVSETQYLWVNISRLRKKLESKHSNHYIHTEPGTGYFFDIL